MSPVETVHQAEPLRVAVVGPGGWGRQHTRVFSGRTDTDLVAIVGRDQDRTAAEAQRLGCAGYTDLESMLDAQAPDLVSVALPNEEHFATTMALLEHGVALLLEKPLVFTLAEASAITDAAARSGAFVAMDFNHRYAEPIQRAARCISSGELGELVFSTWRFGGEANAGASPHKNIIETQCHAFDTLEHLLGPISSISAQMTNRTYGAWSTVALALEYASGAVGTLLGTYDSSYAYRGAQMLEINGTAGRVVVRDTVAAFEHQHAGKSEATTWRAGYFDDEARGFHATFDRYVEAMLTALRSGQRPPVPLQAGVRALELAWCAIESHRSGQRIPTPVHPLASLLAP